MADLTPQEAVEARLRGLAKAVLAPEWTARPVAPRQPPRLPHDCIEIRDGDGDGLAYVGHPVDADYIAAANPTAVLSLLRSLVELRAERDAAVRLRKPLRFLHLAHEEYLAEIGRARAAGADRPPALVEAEQVVLSSVEVLLDATPDDLLAAASTEQGEPRKVDICHAPGGACVMEGENCAWVPPDPNAVDACKESSQSAGEAPREDERRWFCEQAMLFGTAPCTPDAPHTHRPNCAWRPPSPAPVSVQGDQREALNDADAAADCVRCEAPQWPDRCWNCGSADLAPRAPAVPGDGQGEAGSDV